MHLSHLLISAFLFIGTAEPAADPTWDPTVEPTIEPTWDPTADPTANPTWHPTADPTIEPTWDPSANPTADPTWNPTVDPTADPTWDPAVDPTTNPTWDPTADPTWYPTAEPTPEPTWDPTHSGPPGGMPPGDSGAATTSAGLCNIDVGDDSTYIETLESDSSAYNGYVRHIQMTGCPNYQTEGVYYDYDATIMNRDIEIPAYPCFSDADYDLICSGGTIAVTLNGVAVFSRMQGGECDVDDDTVDNNAVENEHDDFDECGGHPSDFGEYHYHIAPSCLLDQMGENDNVTAHSPLIGWAYDGFPVYGPHSVGGVEMYPCDHTNASSEYCLDECGGTSQYEIDGFLYHYHLQGPLSDLVSRPTSPYPGEDRSPYTLGCFKGVPIETNTGGSCESDGFTSDYVPAVTDGVTEVYCTASDISTCNSNATTETPSTTTTDGSSTSESTLDVDGTGGRNTRCMQSVVITMILGVVVHPFGIL